MQGSPVNAVAWQAPPPPGYTGPHAVNTRLAGLQHIELGGEEGPEHVMIGPDGRLYTTVASVLKFFLGLWLALLLNKNIRFKSFFRAVILLPYIVPTALSAMTA